MRAIFSAVAVLTLAAIALHATPASAARIPVPRLDTGRVVELQIAERATAALPAETTSGAAVSSALDDALARMRSRWDAVATAAAEQAAARARLKQCLDGAAEGAVAQLAQSYADGTTADLNSIMYGAAVPCFSNQFPDAVGARIDQFAEAAAGHANEVAYEELSSASSGSYSASDYEPAASSTDSGGSDDGGVDGGAILLGLGIAAVAVVIAIVVFFGRGRRI